MEKKPVDPKKSTQSIISAFVLTLFNSVMTVCGIIATNINPMNIMFTVLIVFFNLPLQVLATVLAIKYYRVVSPNYKILAAISLVPFALFCCMLPILIMAVTFK